MSAPHTPPPAIFVGAALGMDAHGYAQAGPFVCVAIDEASATAYGRESGPVNAATCRNIQILVGRVPDAVIRAAGWVRPGEALDG